MELQQLLTEGTGGTSALLGINATNAITTVTADTAGKGLESSPARFKW
jgi:hypothetical protein